MKTEEELAGVIAHEAAHVVKRHHIKNLRKSMVVAKWMGGAATVFSVVEELLHANAVNNDPAYAAKNRDKGAPKLMSSLLGNIGESYARGLDRDAEYEADRMGVVYLARAGFDPLSYISALQKMEGLGSNNLAAQQFYKTHPSTNTRLETLEKVIGRSFDALPLERMQSNTPLGAF